MGKARKLLEDIKTIQHKGKEVTIVYAPEDEAKANELIAMLGEKKSSIEEIVIRYNNRTKAMSRSPARVNKYKPETLADAKKWVLEQSKPGIYTIWVHYKLKPNSKSISGKIEFHTYDVEAKKWKVTKS